MIINKEKGLSSNQVLQKTKRLFNANKAGHTGSLDPLATGVLPVFFGEATKLAQFLLEADKSYRTIIELGIKTETGDKEGNIIEKKEVNISVNEVKKILHDFIGEISQIPSMYSALKYNGKPLYELARNGITIDRPKRKIKIYNIKFIDLTGNLLTIEVDCSKGTYIRTLAEDIGEKLGCGAYVYELDRIKVGLYNNKNMFSLKELEKIKLEKSKRDLDSLLIPMDSVIFHFPPIYLNEQDTKKIQQGRVISISHINTEILGSVRLYKKFLDDKKNEICFFIGVGCVNKDGILVSKRLLSY